MIIIRKRGEERRIVLKGSEWTEGRSQGKEAEIKFQRQCEILERI